jgi:hypothetical protein
MDTVPLVEKPHILRGKIWSNSIIAAVSFRARESNSTSSRPVTNEATRLTWMPAATSLIPALIAVCAADGGKEPHQHSPDRGEVPLGQPAEKGRTTAFYVQLPTPVPGGRLKRLRADKWLALQVSLVDDGPRPIAKAWTLWRCRMRITHECLLGRDRLHRPVLQEERKRPTDL